MRAKTIRRHISPPRRAIQRLRNGAIENHERIIRAANLHLRLRRRTWRTLRSCGIRIPHARLSVGILHADTHSVVRRVDRARSIVLRRIADRRIHESPMSFANHDDQVSSLRSHHTLKPSPVHQRRFNVILGYSVCLRIFRVNTRGRVNDDRHRVCLQNVGWKHFVLALGQNRYCHQQPKREYYGNTSQHRDLLLFRTNSTLPKDRNNRRTPKPQAKIPANKINACHSERSEEPPHLPLHLFLLLSLSLSSLCFCLYGNQLTLFQPPGIELR